MGLLRRLLGTGGARGPAPDDGADGSDPGPDATEVDAEERSREVELVKAEHARLDELIQRQLRFARYVWAPPSQGGVRRADDNLSDNPADRRGKD